MINLLPNQKKIKITCPIYNKEIFYSQNINSFFNPPILYGKKTCLESDTCMIKNCIYHNCYIGEYI